MALNPNDKNMVVAMLEHGLTTKRQAVRGSDTDLETLSAVFTFVNSIFDDAERAMHAVETVCTENSLFQSAFEKFRTRCDSGEIRVINWL